MLAIYFLLNIKDVSFFSAPTLKGIVGIFLIIVFGAVLYLIFDAPKRAKHEKINSGARVLGALAGGILGLILGISSGASIGGTFFAVALFAAMGYFWDYLSRHM
jgi:hypothetical protein